MDYPVQAPELAGRSVLVRVTGLFADPQLIVDGTPVKADDGLYLLPTSPAVSAPISIRLKAPMLDFVPIVFVGDHRVQIAPALAWWQYLLCLLPTILLIVYPRGVVPAIIGLALSYVSVYLVRQQPERKFVWTALINAGVVLAIGAMIAMRLASRHVAQHP
jgi:hypothetical protein